MFHDVGLIEGHRSAAERFEIDGANAARAFLERHGLPEPQIMTVWQSIALHTTRQIPDYLQPEVRLVALGVSVRRPRRRTSTRSHPSSATTSSPSTPARASRRA